MQAKAAQKEIEEFTLDFKNAARKCFELIDKDGGGTLDKGEIVRAVKEDQEVISFLKTCGEENLMFLLHPPRLKKALEVLDTDGSGEVDVDEWETAINRGLAKRLEQMAKERERRERAAAAADEEFSAEFLTAARKVFQMIDDDDSGTLEKAEIVRAVRANKEVIKFLTDCGNKNLQHLLVPSRLESALAQMDTDHDGTIDADEWCVLESATLGRLSTSPAHRLMFRAGRSASRRRSRTSLSSAPRPARRRARQRSRRSPSSLGSSFPPPSAASSSSTRTVAGRSALDCVEIKS